jgi:glutamate decarboxylase
MAEALPKNFIDYEEYPQTADIQNRCVSMIARMFNAPTASDDENSMGTSTVGSSEAIVRPLSDFLASNRLANEV